MSKHLAVIHKPEEVSRVLEQWRKTLMPLVQDAAKPPIPFNFRVTQCRGGNQLTWSAYAGADGYQILRTITGDFSTATVITVDGANTTTYFDSVAVSGEGALPKVGYKLRAVAGSAKQKHGVIGNATYPVFSTPLENNDLTSIGQVAYDRTTDRERAAARYRFLGGRLR